MKKKDLIQLLKMKSNEIEIKDFSHEIIERASQFPRIKEEIITPQRHFSAKTMFILTLTSMATVFAIMIFYHPEGQTPIPQFEDIDQIIAFSAISTASLIELADDQLGLVEDVTLGFGNQDDPETPKIDSEMVDVSKYMEIMEKLLASQDDFDITTEQSGNPTYQTKMRFRTRDLLNQETFYNVYYNRVNIQNQNQFSMTGLVEIGENTYNISAEGETNDQNHLMMRAAKDEFNFIDIEYVKEDFGYTFYIDTTKDGVVIQQVSLTVNDSDSQKQVILDFIEGESSGSYIFRIDEESMMKIVRISYYIEGEETESGSIIIRLVMVSGEYQYRIFVTPQGGNTYFFERGRGMTEGRGPGNGVSTGFEVL